MRDKLGETAVPGLMGAQTEGVSREGRGQPAFPRGPLGTWNGPLETENFRNRAKDLERSRVIRRRLFSNLEHQ